MTRKALDLLRELKKSYDNGAHSLACDPYTKEANELEGLGYAVWRGFNWGSSFYSITDDGRRKLTKMTGGRL